MVPDRSVVENRKRGHRRRHTNYNTTPNYSAIIAVIAVIAVVLAVTAISWVDTVNDRYNNATGCSYRATYNAVLNHPADQWTEPEDAVAECAPWVTGGLLALWGFAWLWGAATPRKIRTTYHPSRF